MEKKKDKIEYANDLGVFLPHYELGEHRIICPNCSSQRNKKYDKCLSVTTTRDAILWFCHHCEWQGGSKDNGDHITTYSPKLKASWQDGTFPPKKEIAPVVPIISAKNHSLSQNSITWLHNRKISQATAEEFGLYTKDSKLCFPYYLDGELVNIKSRTKDKKFLQEKGATKCLYNIDMLKKHWDNAPNYEDYVPQRTKSIIFVEGEMDVLALYEAGYKNVVSLPDGAPQTAKFKSDDKRFLAFEHSKWIFEADEVVVATDADENGKALRLEIIHRFGKDICKVVNFPRLDDWQCKDANECLISYDTTVLKECIEYAEEFPVQGLHGVKEFHDAVQNIYDGNEQKAFSTGFKELDKIYKIMPSTFNLVTGIPNHGKSNFLDQILLNLAENLDWNFAIFSPEHSTPNHIRRLLEKRCRKPFDIGMTARISQSELNEGVNFLDEHFRFIENTEEIPNIEFILSKAKLAKQRFGIKGLVIDPFNQISPDRDYAKREDEHIRDIIAKCQQFARNHQLVVWMVAHPHKLHRNDSGMIPPPDLYQVSGSAHWANMADVGLVVHRDFENDTTRIITRKIREQGVYGHIGQKFFKFDNTSKVYTEIDENNLGE
jgi:twinkle protein